MPAGQLKEILGDRDAGYFWLRGGGGRRRSMRHLDRGSHAGVEMEKERRREKLAQVSEPSESSSTSFDMDG